MYVPMCVLSLFWKLLEEDGFGWLFSFKTIANLSPSVDKSPSLDAEEPCLDNLTSPGKTSSDRCTVNEVFPRLPNPILRFRPKRNLSATLFYFSNIF